MIRYKFTLKEYEAIKAIVSGKCDSIRDIQKGCSMAHSGIRALVNRLTEQGLVYNQMYNSRSKKIYATEQLKKLFDSGQIIVEDKTNEKGITCHVPFDQDLSRKIKYVCMQKNLRYTTLVHTYVKEMLEKEDLQDLANINVTTLE